MRHLYITVILFSLVRIVAAQSGFSQMVLLPNSRSCTFASVVVSNDTIVCFGDLYSKDQQKWGACLSMFDSTGQLLFVTACFDSVYQQTIDPQCQLIRTSDGGYLGVGSQGVGKKTAAYKFSHDGTLEWSHFYREN
ncbi:MAG: hypothetical protein IT269_02350, partial [Saprospiraceae bacterium]|nr:hypothetical protein [Saprospiraceae bacterium]